MHEFCSLPYSEPCIMIRYSSQKQLSLADFGWPFQTKLDENNRWVTLSRCIPWDQLAETYYQTLSSARGRPTKDARLVIGAVIIKHKLNLSDRETLAQIQENPYLQYFVGLTAYQKEAPFAPSLMVDIRKRMGQTLFDQFQSAIITAVSEKKQATSCTKTVKDDEPPSPPATPAQPELVTSEPEVSPPQGKLILDATVAPQAIRYPTDLSLLNEARELTEAMIDHLFPLTGLKQKPRTYRTKARQDFLAIAKQRKPAKNARRRALKQQLQYLRRNLGHLDQMLSGWQANEPSPLPKRLLKAYWVIQHVYAQQQQMYQTKTQRCDDRIVSIHQPHVRPIVRGKLNRPVEFGAKLSVSLSGDGVACVDHLRWDAFNEGGDLKDQVEAYRQRHGQYPQKVLADPIYGTRENRAYLKELGIQFAGKPLGRPPKETSDNAQALKQAKAQRREDYRQRIPIEGKFGQGKTGYGLDYIRARRSDTSVAWINSIFLVMNLMVLLRIFYGLVKRSFLVVLESIKRWKIEWRAFWRSTHYGLTPTDCFLCCDF